MVVVGVAVAVVVGVGVGVVVGVAVVVAVVVGVAMNSKDNTTTHEGAHTMNPLVPFEEVLMSPNREHAERLFTLVKRQWVLTRDAWPMWARIVQKYGWRAVILAAEQCHPEKRYVNNVEAFAIEIAKQEAVAAKEAADKAESDTRRAQLRNAASNAERAALFKAILKEKGLQ